MVAALEETPETPSTGLVAGVEGQAVGIVYDEDRADLVWKAFEFKPHRVDGFKLG